MQNVSSSYKSYKDKISHSGEENVWQKHAKPFWWDSAEELWATRPATQPDVVLEVGNGVKVEGRKSAAALRALDAEEGMADESEAAGAAAAGAAAAGAAAAGAEVAPAMAAEAEVARREEARLIRQKRKSSAREQAAKEQTDAVVEAGRLINADLMSQFVPLVKDMTAAVKDLPAALALALGGGHRRKKSKRSQLSSERSSPSYS